MKRLYIVVEGQTEQEFTKELLVPYFRELEFYDVRPFLIRTSRTGRGGFVNYQHLKNDVLRLLKQEKDIIVTMFVDYFRIPTNIPDYENCNNQNASAPDKVNCFENAIKNDITDKRFIPYIQLHEFEALLFSSNKGFVSYYEPNVCEHTQSIIERYENPELINNNPETAPSKRLMKIIPNYDKVVDGTTIALEIGLSTIINKCPRFHRWIDDITQKLKE